MPYTTNKEGQGPAWANSLFEDNAEYGYGMYLGVKAQRERIAATEKAAIKPVLTVLKTEALQAWVDTMNDGEDSKAASAAYWKLCKSIQW